MLQIEDLLGALALADAVCTVEDAWNALYADMRTKITDENFPGSQTLREQAHAQVHAAIDGLLNAQNLAAGGMMGLPVSVPVDGSAEDYRPGQYL